MIWNVNNKIWYSEDEIEKLKKRNKLYKKIIVENLRKNHNQIMVLQACIKGEINVDDFKNYAKFHQENKKLKKTLEEVKKYCNECNLKADYTACEILTIIDRSD